MVGQVMTEQLALTDFHSRFRHHREDLMRLGFTIVPNVLSDSEVRNFREIIDALYRLHDPIMDFQGLNIKNGQPDGEALEREMLGVEFNFATCLLTKHSSFWPIIDRELVMSLIKSVIGSDCVLSSLNSLEPLQGRGQQSLHRDEGPVGLEGFVTANTIWVLDSMDMRNGATRLIPGTHHTSELSDDRDTRLMYAEAPAGSVIVMNAHVLHGASKNHDGRRRRVIHGYFTRRGRKVQTNFEYYASPASLASLPASCRALLPLRHDSPR